MFFLDDETKKKLSRPVYGKNKNNEPEASLSEKLNRPVYGKQKKPQTVSKKEEAKPDSFKEKINRPVYGRQKETKPKPERKKGFISRLFDYIDEKEKIRNQKKDFSKRLDKGEITSKDKENIFFGLSNALQKNLPVLMSKAKEKIEAREQEEAKKERELEKRRVQLSDRNGVIPSYCLDFFKKDILARANGDKFTGILGKETEEDKVYRELVESYAYLYGVTPKKFNEFINDVEY